MHLRPREKTVLIIAFGASVLIWSALILSTVILNALPAAAYGAPPPLAVFSPSPTPWLSPTLLPPTQTATPLPTPTATHSPTPAPTPTWTPTVPPEERLLVDDDTIVIALLGIDEAKGSKLWRTDSLILVFVQRKEQRLGMLSIPRDLWVPISGHGSNRINTVDSLGERTNYPGGGPALLEEVLRAQFKVRIDHWVRIDFGGFVRIVDALGGLEIDVQEPLTDSFPDPTSPTGKARITLPVGPRQMDGRMVLSYSRSRVTTSDFDRSRRQQQVLVALWQKALTAETLLKAPKLWSEFRDSFETDLNMAQAAQLGYICAGIGIENVQSVHLDYKTARPWTTYSGAKVLQPDTQAIQAIIRELVDPPPADQ